MGKAMRWAALLLALATGEVFGAAAGAATIRGRVLDDAGGPAAGATVRAIAPTPGSACRGVVTDADGRFALEVEPATWSIEAVLGDRGTDAGTQVQVRVQVGDEGRDPDPVAIRLRPQGHLRGRLIEAETGRPIAGGRFFLDNGEVPVSDSDGRFEAGGLRRSWAHEAVVVAPGRERLAVRFGLADRPATDLEIAVPRGGKAVGLVIDAAGKPIPRARVGRFLGGNAFANTALWITADDRGRFVYDGLRPGQTTSLDISADGFLMTRRDDIRSGPLGEPTALLVRLIRQAPPDPRPAAAPAVESGRVVAGIVTDPEGRPVADALVRWPFGSAPDRVETRTDASGRFRLRAIPPQSTLCSVLPPGLDLAPAVVRIKTEVAPGFRIPLARARTASGIVRDDRGTPLERVAVTPILSDEGKWSLHLPELATTTDARGHFVVPGLPGSNVLAQFARDGVTLASSPVLALDRENVVTMEPTGTIRGRVVDGADRPVRSFRVVLNPSRRPGPADKPVNPVGEFGGTGLSFTADDGSFQIRDLGAGAAYRATIIAPGFGGRSIDRVVAEPNNHIDPDRVATFRLDPPRSLTVRVTDQVTGAPLSRARVSVVADESTGLRNRRQQQSAQRNDSAHAESSEAGAATFAGLPFGGGVILVERPGYLTDQVICSENLVDLALALRPEAVFAGELLDRATNLPLDAGLVRLTSPAAGQLHRIVQPDDNGRFRIDGLPAGTYTCSVASTTNQPLHTEVVTLEAGETVRRTIHLDLRPAADDPDKDLFPR